MMCVCGKMPYSKCRPWWPVSLGGFITSTSLERSSLSGAVPTSSLWVGFPQIGYTNRRVWQMCKQWLPPEGLDVTCWTSSSEFSNDHSTPRRRLGVPKTTPSGSGYGIAYGLEMGSETVGEQRRRLVVVVVVVPRTCWRAPIERAPASEELDQVLGSRDYGVPKYLSLKISQWWRYHQLLCYQSKACTNSHSCEIRTARWNWYIEIYRPINWCFLLSTLARLSCSSLTFDPRDTTQKGLHCQFQSPVRKTSLRVSPDLCDV